MQERPDVDKIAKEGGVPLTKQSLLGSDTKSLNTTRSKQTPTQKKLLAIELLVYEEIDKYYAHHKAASDFNRIYAIADDEPLRSMVVKFYKKNETVIEAKEVARIYFTWDGKEIKSYDDYIRFLQDFIRHSQERRVRLWWQFITSPLSIGGLIGVMLVIVVAVQLFSGHAVPDALWQVLTAVIAFYFGRNSGLAIPNRKNFDETEPNIL